MMSLFRELTPALEFGPQIPLWPLSPLAPLILNLIQLWIFKDFHALEPPAPQATVPQFFAHGPLLKIPFAKSTSKLDAPHPLENQPWSEEECMEPLLQPPLPHFSPFTEISLLASSRLISTMREDPPRFTHQPSCFKKKNNSSSPHKRMYFVLSSVYIN